MSILARIRGALQRRNEVDPTPPADVGLGDVLVATAQEVRVVPYGSPTDGDVLTVDSSSPTGWTIAAQTGGGGGGGSPVGATYLVVSLDATLTNERRLLVGTGLAIVDGGANADLTISPALDLAAVEALATTGLAVRTGTSTWTTRTIAVAGTGLSIADGDGVAAAPTITISPSAVALAGYPPVPRPTFSSKAIEYMMVTPNAAGSAALGSSIYYSLHYQEHDSLVYDAFLIANSAAAAGGVTVATALYSVGSNGNPDALLWSATAVSAAVAATTFVFTFAAGTWTAAGASYKNGSNNLVLTRGMAVWKATANSGNVGFRVIVNKRTLGLDATAIQNASFSSFSEGFAAFPSTATPVSRTAADLPVMGLRYL